MNYLIFVSVFTFLVSFGSTDEEIPPYVKQCREDDPKLTQCIIGAVQHLQPYLTVGIPEIDLPAVEPFIIDELSLALTSGPNGYKITLKDLQAFGASNYTVQKLKLSEDGKPFEVRLKIPKLRISSEYASSGVLIILPASGGGSLSGTFEDVTVYVKGTVISRVIDGKNYLFVDNLAIDMKIKNVKLMVDKIFNNNRILTEATNLFLRENGQEVIKAMTPQLNQKLSTLFKGIVNKLVTHVPISTFLIPASN